MGRKKKVQQKKVKLSSSEFPMVSEYLPTCRLSGSLF